MSAGGGGDAERAPLAVVTRGMCIALTVFQLYAVYASAIDPLLHRAVFVSVVLALVFFTGAGAPASRTGGRAARAAALGWGAASLAVGAYYVAQFAWIRYRWPHVDDLTLAATLCGAALFVAVLEATRRMVGWTLGAVIVAFVAYALAGHLTEGLFHHRPLAVVDVIDELIYTGNGLFGAPVAVASTYVFLFVLFGTALELSGAGDFIFRLASAVTGRARGGPAKVAVASSALYGTITGSPTSNVVTTGLFTIPMMKRVGFRGDVAAAVESVASTGGGLLPPVMGSAAFLMVELTGIDYLTICIAALVPALLFYLGVFMQVHWGAARLAPGSGTPAPERLGAVLRHGAHHLVPLVALVGLLLAGSTPINAAGVALVLTVATSWVRRETRMGIAEIVRLLELGAQRALLVTVACAAAGLVVGAIAITGLGGKVTSLIFSYASGSLVFALLVTMVVCILLGMGMPVPSAYVLTAVLAAPPLVLLGLPELSAHLFILYFAVLSAITPPVAVAAYAASGIAQEHPGRVALQAVRLGLVAFVIPYYFVFRPELLLRGSPAAIPFALLTSVVGVLFLAAALEGFVRTPLRRWERVLALAGGLCLVFPGWLTDVTGLALGILGTRRQVPRAATRRPAA